MNRLIIRLALLAVMIQAPLALAQSNLLINGSFETGDFTGWTVVNTGSGQFSVESGTVTPTSSSAIPAPPDGTFASVSDQSGPGSHILYQDVFIPDNGKDVFLSFLLYWNNQAEVWADNGTFSEVGDPNQHLRVDIMDPGAPVDDVGAGVLMNILKPTTGDPFQFGYEHYQVGLTQFAGQTVRIRFGEVDNQGFFNLGVDAVQVRQITPVPVDHPLALIVFALGLLLMGTWQLRARTHST